jgi:hypothetical protein
MDEVPAGSGLGAPVDAVVSGRWVCLMGGPTTVTPWLSTHVGLTESGGLARRRTCQCQVTDGAELARVTVAL